MTDKEIYKAREEGLNLVSELRQNYSPEAILELLDIAFHLSKKNSPNYELHRKEKVLEKAEARMRFIKLFNR